MDRNTIYGLVIIMTILIGYSIYMQPSQKEIEAAKMKRDSIMLVQQMEMAKSKALAQKSDTIEKKQTVINVVEDSLQRSRIYGSFAKNANGTTSFITLENNLLRIKFSNKGGRVYSVELKEFHKFDSTPLVLFNGDSTQFGFKFFAQGKDIYTNDLFFTPVKTDEIIKVDKDEKSLTYRLFSGDSNYIEYVYTLKPNSYVVDFKVHFINMNNVLASNTNSLGLKWECYIPQLEKGRKNENDYTSIHYKYYKDEENSLKAMASKDQEEELPTRVRWVAFKQQFFASVLIADSSFSNGFVKFNVLDDSSKYLKRAIADLTIPFNLDAKESIPLKYYFGPNHYNTLKKQNLELEELVSLGSSIVKWINKYCIIPIFNFLESFIGNYGIIILILTIIIKIVLLPLTYGSYLSTAKMKVLKPQVEEITNKIPKDKAMERQQATMALYKKAGVNPLGGCIPLLLQMPILFAMYRFFPTSFELRQEGFLWANDLSTFDSIFNLPFTIPAYGNHISLFTILFAVSMVFQMKLSNQQAAGSQMAGMQAMIYIMPIMMLVMFNNLSSGLSYYMLLTNIIGFGQNELFKLFVNEEKLLHKIESNKKKPVKKSKFQARLEEMAKQKGYKLPKK